MDTTLIFTGMGAMVFIIGLVLMFVMGKKKDSLKMAGVITVIGGVMLVSGLFILPATGGASAVLSAGSGVQAAPAQSGTVVVNAQTATVLPQATNFITGASLTSTDLNVVLYRGSPLVFGGSASLGTAIGTGASGQPLELYFINATGTANYYPQKLTAVSDGTANQLVTAKMKAVGSITQTVWNDDDTTINAGTAGTAQTITAGQTKAFRLKFAENTSNGYFGDEKIAFCADYNSTAYTTLELHDMSGNLVPTSGSGNLGAATTQDTTHNLKVNCWEIPESLKNYGSTQYRLIVTANTGQNPGIGDSNINGRIVDQYLVKNTNTGAYVESYFDPVTNGTIGATDGTFTITVD